MLLYYSQIEYNIHTTHDYTKKKALLHFGNYIQDMNMRFICNEIITYIKQCKLSYTFIGDKMFVAHKDEFKIISRT